MNKLMVISFNFDLLHPVILYLTKLHIDMAKEATSTVNVRYKNVKLVICYGVQSYVTQ